MSAIDPRSFSDELAEDIRQRDVVKAKAVLAYLDDVDEVTRRRALLDLSRSEDAFAVAVLGHLLSTKPDLGTRYPTLRAAFLSKAMDCPDALLALIPQARTAEKILLLRAIEELRLDNAAPALLALLGSERDERVLEVVIDGLGALGDPAGAGPISEFLYSTQPGLASAAVIALGRIGSPTAIQRLAERLGTDATLDSLIFDVLAESQDARSIHELGALLSSHQARLRVAAKDCLVRVGPKAVPMLAENLDRNDPDLAIHTLNVLGDIGDPAAVPAIRRLVHTKPANPNIRFAAYEALGFLPLSHGAYTLAGGLSDAEPHVRAAAAKAIDRNLDDILLAGLKNLVQAGGDESDHIVEAVIETLSDNVFLGLVDEEPFPTLAVDRLVKAHKDVRDHFAELLQAKGYRRLATQIGASGHAERPAGLNVFAVDDSRMILNIYRTGLHNLGHASTLFEFPLEALGRLETEKPDILFTDLNMPKLTGIELARGARRLYPSGQLPIILVTTQDDSRDHADAYAAGIDAILLKPFTEAQLAAAIARFVAA
jgi:CheY-like chemotaxis protein/HEAT repeat protein